MDLNEFLTRNETAQLLRLSARTLERMAVHGGGPAFVKAGRRVIYSREEIAAWVGARTITSTSQGLR